MSVLGVSKTGHLRSLRNWGLVADLDWGPRTLFVVEALRVFGQASPYSDVEDEVFLSLNKTSPERYVLALAAFWAAE